MGDRPARREAGRASLAADWAGFLVHLGAFLLVSALLFQLLDRPSWVAWVLVIWGALVALSFAGVVLRTIARSSPLAVGLLLVAVGAAALAWPAWGPQAGPLRTERVEFLGTRSATAVSLRPALARLRVSVGAEAPLAGEIAYNSQALRPRVVPAGDSVRVEQPIQGLIPFGLENRWDLRLGDAVPLSLDVFTGGSSGEWELGGVPLEELRVNQGFSRASFGFSRPNPQALADVQVDAVASDVRFENLANARFQSLAFRGGAGSYAFDFGGELQADASATVHAGAANVAIVVPKDTPARVRFEGILTDVGASGPFAKVGDEYVIEGEGPHQLTITVHMWMGTLQISTVPDGSEEAAGGDGST